jgi:hypothetical protein
VLSIRYTFFKGTATLDCTKNTRPSTAKTTAEEAKIGALVKKAVSG